MNTHMVNEKGNLELSVSIVAFQWSHFFFIVGVVFFHPFQPISNFKNNLQIEIKVMTISVMQLISH